MAGAARGKAVLVAVVVVVVAAMAAVAHAASGNVQIESTFLPSPCTDRAKNGDQLKVHYRGKLLDGTQFDASYDRGQPLPVKLGARQVIVGWEEGLQGMCLGEKRVLTIPPEKGYGSRGAGKVIPPDATLIFETELVAIGSKTYDASKAQASTGSTDL